MDETTPLFNVPTAAPAAAATIVPAGSTHAVPAPQSDHYVEHDGKHKGIAGVARDILGTLGDFLLTRLHMPAMYAPAQQQRKLEAAIQGFDTDPIGAINRVTDVDYTAGAKLRDQFIDNQRMAAQQASTQEARATRMQLAQTAQNDRTRQRVGSMLNSMGNWDETRRQTNYPALRDQMLRYGKANNLDLSSELPETYDPAAIDSFVQGAVPVGTQQRLSETKDHHEVQEDQGDTRNDLTRRGQDITHTDRIRGQDLGHDDRVRGQDLGHDDRVRGQDITHNDRVRGQDITKDVATTHDNTVRRGQDITSRDRRRGQDMRRPPQEGETRVVGGKTYVWRNGKAVIQN